MLPRDLMNARDGAGDAYVRDRADQYVCVTSRSRNQ